MLKFDVIDLIFCCNLFSYFFGLFGYFVIIVFVMVVVVCMFSI